MLKGPCFPAIGYILVNWVPLNERSRLIGLSFSGVQIGNLVATLLGGIFCSTEYVLLRIFEGWSMNFYFFGFMGILWTILFYVFGSDKPDTNIFTSHNEKVYLIKTINPNSKNKSIINEKVLEEEKVDKKPAKTTPWKAILTSRIVFTLNICCFCYNWGIYLYLTQIPSYVKDVLKFDVRSVIRILIAIKINKLTFIDFIFFM